MRHLCPVAIPGIRAYLRWQRREVSVESDSRRMLKYGFEVRLHLRCGHAWSDTAHDLEPPICGPLQQWDVWLARGCRRVRKLSDERERHSDVGSFAHGLLDVNQIR